MGHKDSSFNVRSLIKDHFFRGPIEWDYRPDIIYKLLDLAEKSLSRQPSMLELRTPLVVCGDLHGQYQDLLQIFQSQGLPFQQRYLFLGDYVDRGTHSLEILMLLLACKVEYPDNMFLLRGNHEISSVNKYYGFFGELRMRFHRNNEWDGLYRRFCQVFGYLPVAALVNGTVLCVHGGLAPTLKSLDDLRSIKRPEIEPADGGLLENILWADPSLDCAHFSANTDRNCSYIYGKEAVDEIFEKLGISLLIRAHQMVDHGYEYFANRRVVTLFSAPGYNDSYENLGAIMKFTRDGECNFYQFDSATPVDRSRSRFTRIASTE
ncbi:unnamed protein product, partial [Mesorhabditis belari]|uniref:Serine/threonine-protein phosphatase n=1 Tax=Mesorhabditis belari TaxID=2138241 RepID=A0AAF3J3Y8_9BILA